MEKGVRNLRFLTTLVPRRHVMATCFILRQLALNNSRLPLFPTLSLLVNIITKDIPLYYIIYI